MPSPPIQYYLKGKVFYLHRQRPSQLVLSLGRYLAMREREGETLEAGSFYPSESGGWSAWVLMQDPNKPPVVPALKVVA